jgi:acylphosphatase
MKQMHVHFSGEVIKVGFRYTTFEYAKELNITGWVKNTLSGKAELLAQGEEKDLELLLYKLKDRFKLTDVQVAWKDVTENFSSFEVVR